MLDETGRHRKMVEAVAQAAQDKADQEIARLEAKLVRDKKIFIRGMVISCVAAAFGVLWL